MKTSSSADLIVVFIYSGRFSDKYQLIFVVSDKYQVCTNWEPRSQQRSHSSRPSLPPLPRPPLLRILLPQNFHLAKKSPDIRTPIGGSLSTGKRLCTESVSAGSRRSHCPKKGRALVSSKQRAGVGEEGGGDEKRV